jgi:hypothetical protein
VCVTAEAGMLIPLLKKYISTAIVHSCVTVTANRELMCVYTNVGRKRHSHTDLTQIK